MVASLSGLAALADILEHRLDPLLVDQPQAGVRQAQADPALLALEPEPAVLQVGEEAALGSVVGMGHVVPDLRLLAGDLADSRHDGVLRCGSRKARIIGGKPLPINRFACYSNPRSANDIAAPWPM